MRFDLLFFVARCMFSMWIFLTRPCQKSLCGVFHHIDSHNDYASPTLLLASSGTVISSYSHLSNDQTHCFIKLLDMEIG